MTTVSSTEVNPSDHKPTCQWYMSMDKPECGDPAPFKVKVLGKVTKAVINVCSEHKAQHDRAFARLRTARKEAS